MTFFLSATSRTAVGKRAKNVRADGFIPAVIYGHGTEPKAIQLGTSEFFKIYRAAGSSSLIDVKIDGEDAVKVLIQDVQVNPLNLKPQHVDLRRIKMDEKLTVSVPLVFEGESAAVKELAGTLVRSYDALTVTCLPADLPPSLKIDLSQLKTFDDTITIADIVLPPGVEVAEEPTVTLASVATPLSEEQLKKMEEGAVADVTAVKTEAEEKKAEEEAEKAEEAAAEEAAS